ncbi:Putative protein of unknown function [Podospora comata]|uniref:J domain-containing protein n=1 Tax=Podospora comata TaxID=48703 RepID=A0ABY6SN44_PODCO|nr:Putative protein of unknown function [Podospora comata]
MSSPNKRLQHYNMLGVRPDATFADVKKAYHRMARLRHPDKHGNSAAATADFQELQQAYEILSDPKARHTYDQTIATKLSRTEQARRRYAELLDRVQRDSARVQPTVDYKRRLFEAFTFRLKQKQRAYDVAQRRIIDAKAFVVISDDDSDEPTQPPQSDTQHASTGEMPPQTVQDLALAKQDHQKATADMRDAETNWKRLKEEVDVLLDKVWSSEKECAELEKEHNPRWQDSQTAQIPSQLSFHGGPQTMSQGRPSQYEASQYPPNPSPTTPPPRSHRQRSSEALPTFSPRSSYSSTRPPPDQEQHYQRARSFSFHGSNFRHPPPPQPPWQHHQRPMAPPHPFGAMETEIKILRTFLAEKNRIVNSLLQKNLALEDEVQRLRRMLDQANNSPVHKSGDVEPITRKKRGRPRNDTRDSANTDGRGPKAARTG